MLIIIIFFFSISSNRFEWFSASDSIILYTLWTRHEISIRNRLYSSNFSSTIIYCWMLCIFYIWNSNLKMPFIRALFVDHRAACTIFKLVLAHCHCIWAELCSMTDWKKWIVACFRILSLPTSTFNCSKNKRKKSF